MKKFIIQTALLLALGAFAAAQSTPTTTPNNTDNSGVQNPTQPQASPVPNPNAPPPPDMNSNSNATGTAAPSGSATPDATTNKSGDADQNTTTTPPPTTQDQTTTTTTQSDTTASSAAGKKAGKDSLVGCLESASNGQFSVRTKNGKEVNVVATSTMSGNLSEHVGERVRANGAYSKSSAAAMNMPQSDQPTTSATAKSETDNPAKDATLPPTVASGTSASNASNANGTPAANPDSGVSATTGSNREFRADSIATLSKTCGSNSNPR